MTPLDEMRAGFEAKHKLSKVVEWNSKTNDYRPSYPKDSRSRIEAIYTNLLWQGYQSAMEDRGEVMLWRVLNTDGEPFSRWNEGKPSPDLVQKVQGTGRTVQIAYTAPQPAPDQWNAAIEAAAEAIESIGWYAPTDTNKVKKLLTPDQAKAAILALRKGA